MASIRNRIKTTITLLAALMATSVQAEKINWYVLDIPPYHIKSGPFELQGVTDILYSYWSQASPDLEHKFLFANIPRVVSVLENAPKNTCMVAGFIDDSYLDRWVRSKPLFYEQPPVLATRKEVWQQLNEPESLELLALLNGGEYKLGITDQQALGPIVSQAVSQTPFQDNIISISTSQTEESVLRMLVAGRIDFSVEYAGELGWLITSGNFKNTADVKTIVIQGQENYLTPVYAACSKDEFGQAVIDRLNLKIDQAFYAEIWSRYLDWLPDSESQKRFLEDQFNLLK